MDIRIESLLEGADRASGAVAVIDVLRAFTTAAVAFARGAAQIVMVGGVEEALALRERVEDAGRWRGSSAPPPKNRTRT